MYEHQIFARSQSIGTIPMPKMSKTEMDLLIEAAYWRMGWHDSNPDVGWGPFVEDVVDGMIRDKDLHPLDYQRDHVIKMVKLRRNR